MLKNEAGGDEKHLFFFTWPNDRKREFELRNNVKQAFCDAFLQSVTRNKTTNAKVYRLRNEGFGTMLSFGISLFCLFVCLF